MKIEVKKGITKTCALCKGTGEPRGYILKNGNPCVRCGGYQTISVTCDNLPELTQREKEQIEIENADY